MADKGRGESNAENAGEERLLPYTNSSKFVGMITFYYRTLKESRLAALPEFRVGAWVHVESPTAGEPMVVIALSA